MGENSATRRTFGEDAAFLSKHTDVIVIGRGDARLAVAPALQARVMTSTTGGDEGLSFGWLNYKLIEKGIREPDAVKGTLEEHIYVFGGEERFWLGPEGGQFAIFFKPGDKFVFDDWKTPPPIDTEPFNLVSRTEDSVVCAKDFSLLNYSGTAFEVGVQRTVRVLDAGQTAEAAGVEIPGTIRAVAYETDNRLTNKGEKSWTKESGMLSIWILGMYNPGPNITVVIPFEPGPESELGPIVNDAYFGKVPAERLIVKESELYFRADGAHRSKIGLTPERSKGVAGSYDADNQVLTVVTFTQPEDYVGYVNSMWELQDKPFDGDVLNSYNDGAPAPGQPPLGPFYELETSSPAAQLDPGETLRHVQTTIHLQGEEADLDPIARKIFGVGLEDIKQAF
jgi:uncharacterized RmlC-like cupin family protein